MVLLAALASLAGRLRLPLPVRPGTPDPPPGCPCPRGEPPREVVDAAVAAAMLSPCRSKRGVAVWTPSGLVAVGCNEPPPPFACDGTDACRAACPQTAMHAEAAALVAAGREARGARMLHVKVVDGLLIEGGPPSCVQCSKTILAAGIATMDLFVVGRGWVRWSAADFHLASLRAKRLHEARLPEDSP